MVIGQIISFKNRERNQGQALVLLLVSTAIGIITTSAVITAAIVVNQSTALFTKSQLALALAESGVENAIIRLLREPNYTGETLNLADGQVVVSVTGGTNKTIVAQASVVDVVRKIQVDGTFSNTVFTINNWREVD